MTAARRVLRSACTGPCEDYSADPGSDLRTLIGRMADGPLRGYYVDSDGRRRPAAVGRLDLFSLLLIGDFAPAVRGAAGGLPRQRRARRPGPARAAQARRCCERPRSAESARCGGCSASGPSPRPRARRRRRPGRAARRWASDALPRSPPPRFGPPSSSPPSTGRPSWRSPRCASAGPWPAPLRRRRRRAAPAPTLLLEGADDIRTNVEGARKVAAGIPGARVVVAPGGHDVTADSCGARLAARFLAGRGAGECTSLERSIGEDPPAEPLAPLRLRDVAPARGVGGRPGRTLTAAVFTVFDSLSQSGGIFGLLFSDDGVVRGGGAARWLVGAAPGRTRLALRPQRRPVRAGSARQRARDDPPGPAPAARRCAGRRRRAAPSS